MDASSKAKPFPNITEDDTVVVVVVVAVDVVGGGGGIVVLFLILVVVVVRLVLSIVFAPDSMRRSGLCVGVRRSATS